MSCECQLVVTTLPELGKKKKGYHLQLVVILMHLLTIDTVTVPLISYVKPDFVASLNFEFDAIKLKTTIRE